MCDYCHADKQRTKMKPFVVGETWRTRQGELVDIVSVNYPHPDYPILGRFQNVHSHVCGLTFTKDGYQVMGTTSPNDLHERVNFETPSEQEAAKTISSVPDVRHPFQQIIDAGRTAKPMHKGGYGSNMVYITPEMYAALAAAIAEEKVPNADTLATIEEDRDWSESDEENRQVRLERDVFRAVLEGMEFRDLDQMVQRDDAVEFGRRVGQEATRIAKDIKATLERLVGIRRGV